VSSAISSPSNQTQKPPSAPTLVFLSAAWALHQGTQSASRWRT
jgi:hypothetical protein